jgi:uncharacterized protein (TIGR02118 family)
VKRILVLYGHPEDPKAFDRHYREVHVPLVEAMPHLHAFEYSDGGLEAADAASPYHLVATLDFASGDALQAAMSSPEGVTATADVANFATGGATVLTMDVARAAG